MTIPQGPLSVSWLQVARILPSVALSPKSNQAILSLHEPGKTAMPAGEASPVSRPLITAPFVVLPLISIAGATLPLLFDG